MTFSWSVMQLVARGRQWVVALAALSFANAVLAWPPPEIKHATDDYGKFPKEQRYHTRYLSTYAVPEGHRETLDAVLSFWLNSLSSRPRVRRPTRISETMWRIDIRDYGWSGLSYATVSKRESYYYTKGADDSGPLIVRADWLVYETSDGSHSDSYYQLLYDGKPPANAKEFETKWLYQRAQVEAIGLETGAAVDTGASIVALHNRVLIRGPTILGAFHQSYDTATGIGTDDFIEHLLEFAANADASEYITSLPNGGHAYLLAAGAESNRIEFADPAVARDTTESGDVRVKTPRSCVTCHGPADGLHIPVDSIRKLYDRGITIASGYEQSEKVSNLYLSDHPTKLEADRAAYRTFVSQCNGDTPEMNAKKYRDVLHQYELPITLDDAARELAIPADQLGSVIQGLTDARTLGLLQGFSIPRAVWESETFPVLRQAIVAAQSKKQDNAKSKE